MMAFDHLFGLLGEQVAMHLVLGSEFNNLDLADRIEEFVEERTTANLLDIATTAMLMIADFELELGKYSKEVPDASV